MCLKEVEPCAQYIITIPSSIVNKIGRTYVIHSKFRSIALVVTKVHVILWSFAVLTRMSGTIQLV